jgi:hypothetical protein
MLQFPRTPSKIRERIRRYERDLRKEQKTHGSIHDGYGKRYLLGPLYLLAGDLTGALASFEWFERTFPDDMGDPLHYLCWTLALYRGGDTESASRKLRQTMLANLYVIPHLLGLEQKELDMWHGSNLAEKDYLDDVPPEIWALWDPSALQWARETYKSPALSRVRTRYIEIYRQLKSEQPGPKRSALVREAFSLLAIADT